MGGEIRWYFEATIGNFQLSWVVIVMEGNKINCAYYPGIIGPIRYVGWRGRRGRRGRIIERIEELHRAERGFLSDAVGRPANDP